METRSVYLRSLGCRLNQSEVERLARQYAAAGHTLVDEPTRADLCVVNTCAVTARAERKSQDLIRSIHQDNPTARIAAVGCCATLSAEALARIPGVAWVVPNAQKSDTVRITGSEMASGFSLAPKWGALDEFAPRTRAFVKVQEGCDNHCAYCVTSLLRGPGRSRALDDVIAELRGRVQAGYREAVLTGVNLGSYGQDLGMERGLYRLVEAILTETELPRLRLSSVEPWGIDLAFLKLWESSRLCRHLHLPLQSGCDRTLRRMARPITTQQYARLVEAAREIVPGIAITADVMVGFPGEDDAAFEESLDFVERMNFARLHVFPFSSRPGTTAAKMPDQVSLDVRRERSRRLRKLGTRQQRRFRRRFVGCEMDVLWERRRPNGLWRGWTDNYVRVVTASSAGLHNRVTRTRLVAMRDGALEGELLDF